jgi:hypothetical protein
VYRGERGEVVYDFTWSRNRDGPMKMLAGYRGFLQVDAPPAYDDVFAQRPEIIEAGRWALARPYFKEALPTAAVTCVQVLALIGQLYGIEGTATDRRLDACARQRLRQAEARPILETLRVSCRSSRPRRYRRAPLGTAIGYTLRNCTALTRYTDDGRLQLITTARSRRCGRSSWAGRIICLRAAKQRRTARPSCVPSSDL